MPMSYREQQDDRARRDILETTVFKEEQAFKPHADSHSLIRSAYDVVADAGSALRTLGGDAAGKVRDIENNDYMNPDAKRRLLAEARSDAASAYARVRDRLNNAVDVMEATAFSAAIPRIAHDREALARDEALMLLSSTSDPVSGLEELASRGGEMSALAASSWGESYLRAKGVSARQATKMHREVVQVSAVHAVMTSDGDPKTKAAAEAYFALTHMKRAVACRVAMACDDLALAGVSV
jgi:hypothetical protein